MPIKQYEEAISSSQKETAECESDKDCNRQSTSCTCDSDQEEEWETDTEELLHVEINGIFQVKISISKM